MPIAEEKIAREVKILTELRGGVNIVQLVDIVKDPVNDTIVFVMEFVKNSDAKKLYKTFSDMDVRYYMYEILKAMDYAASRGVMHRDIKPANIMIDPDLKKVRVIDWGISEFYKPN